MDATIARIEARSRVRAAAAEERERVRRDRREERSRLASADPHDPAARQPRASGRKDIVREQRDTTGYAVVIDEERIRALAGRGATAEGLAKVFDLSPAEIARILDRST